MAGIAATAAAIALAACGGGGGEASGTGTVQVSMTDAPACYRQVVVTVEKVRVQSRSDAGESESAWKDIVPAGGPVQVDLLALTNGQLEDLGQASVEAGRYRQLRLVLADNPASGAPANYVVLNDGQTKPLETPSGQQSGLKIQGDFRVTADATTPVLLDFDACKSVVVAGSSGRYILKPVVRLSERASASIQGYVTTTMRLGATTVSAQQDGEIVRSTTPDGQGRFSLAYLPAGTYDVVITSGDRASGLVSAVPVGTSSVVLNGTSTAVVLPTSTMGTVTGVVTAGASPVTDASVAARQSVGGLVLEIASTNVDATSARYTLVLPAAAPVRYTWTASGGLSAPATTTTAPGAYRLRADSPTEGTQERSVTVTGDESTTADIAY
jgi:hypothetical protein